MSWRGSFCTAYIDCVVCLAAAKEVLAGDDKYHCGSQLPGWGGGHAQLPIIAGKIGGLAMNSELDTLADLVDELKPKLCHGLIITGIAESGLVKVHILKPEPKPATNRLTLKPHIEKIPEICAYVLDYANDSEKLVELCAKEGYEIDALTAYNVWNELSGDSAASWLSINNRKNIVAEIIKYCDVTGIIQEEVKSFIQKLVLKKELEASETIHPYHITDCKKIVAHCKSKNYLIDELTAYNAWTAFSDGQCVAWCDVDKAIAKRDLITILTCCCDVETIEDTKKE